MNDTAAIQNSSVAPSNQPGHRFRMDIGMGAINVGTEELTRQMSATSASFDSLLTQMRDDYQQDRTNSRPCAFVHLIKAEIDPCIAKSQTKGVG